MESKQEKIKKELICNISRSVNQAFTSLNSRIKKEDVENKDLLIDKDEAQCNDCSLDKLYCESG